jgi:DNA-binding NarL/FixJ family response regulator
MQLLLAKGLDRASPDPVRVYANHIFSQFDAEPYMVKAGQIKASPTGDQLGGSRQALVEPLTRRELEVLHLMALGKTNQEIALQLVVSPGTVKAHTASIYRKLDVANRTEAAARARQLGILPENPLNSLTTKP